MGQLHHLMDICPIIEIVTSLTLLINMSQWVRSFANNILCLLCVLSSFSCIHQDPHTYQASYSVSILNIGDDKSLAIYVNTNFSDFKTTSYPQNRGHSIPIESQVRIDKYIWSDITGLFDKNRFPERLDGLFIVENQSSNPQKCFIYLEGAYPSKKLKSSRFISNSGIRIDSLKSKVDSLLKIKDYKSLNSYWEEIHKINQEIALEVQPKQKILLPWR